ncbi:MAG: hypothetical protein U9N35_05705 [Euryarchaeota archaeon]|nr:hypothetical protein [Euryarchaeota archaeon]
MKEEPEPLWPLLTVAGVLAVLMFVISMSFEWWGNTILRSALVTALVLMLLADIQMIRHYHRERAQNVPKSDERLDRIVIYASAYAFRVGIFFMIMLIFAHLLEVLTMDTIAGLSASVFVMAGSYFVFHLYFNKRGDVK